MDSPRSGERQSHLTVKIVKATITGANPEAAYTVKCYVKPVATNAFPTISMGMTKPLPPQNGEIRFEDEFSSEVPATGEIKVKFTVYAEDEPAPFAAAATPILKIFLENGVSTNKTLPLAAPTMGALYRQGSFSSALSALGGSNQRGKLVVRLNVTPKGVEADAAASPRATEPPQLVMLCRVPASLDSDYQKDLLARVTLNAADLSVTSTLRISGTDTPDKVVAAAQEKLARQCQHLLADQRHILQVDPKDPLNTAPEKEQYVWGDRSLSDFVYFRLCVDAQTPLQLLLVAASVEKLQQIEEATCTPLLRQLSEVCFDSPLRCAPDSPCSGGGSPRFSPT
eukprot:TRINITY_DN27092_c0_g1_i1.p1 TRINITY_DN27092_c0_g1~~TRINITY_DN27092_c0_g1_i1.p1  ORF type:complete len:350 (+),score=64.73 TRINITY_DN27092_c0_g1_i1:33-1052(+)